MRPISSSLAPNMQKDDVFLALKTILKPWTWNNNSDVEKLETLFSSRLVTNRYCLAVNSGRSALYMILKNIGVQKADEVILQAFTCVVVPNAIIKNGATPIYVDVDDSYNIDPKDLERKITKNTKAIIIQNTFGIPADYSAIYKIATKKGIPLIEDCAHSLGATYKGKKVGSIADYSIFSFGRDKIISSVFGGMICVKDSRDFEKLRKMREEIINSSFLWTFQQLLHPISFSVILPLYNVLIGKGLLFILQKLGLLSFAVYPAEKKGKQPSVFPKKMSPALAKLAINQLGKVDSFNSHRKNLARFYKNNVELATHPPFSDDSCWLRYPVQIKNKKEVVQKLKGKKIMLGDWYSQVIVPVENLSMVGYSLKSCPNAEKMSKGVINLPTYPNLTTKDAQRIVKELNQCLN